MTLEQYIDSVNKRYKLGNTTEHSFRGDLQQLIENLVPGIRATNEPKRQQCGAPDYILTRKGIPLGYIEAKDIGADLASKNYKEQFDRYKQSLDNLIITDYLTFQIFREGNLHTSVSIGQIQGNKIIGKPEKYAEFTLLIKEFCTYTGQTIKSSARLSKMMAAKARLLANVIERALVPTEGTNQVNEPENITLHDQFISFKQVLLHDIREKEFADIYAQTIAYGMFAARLHDPSLVDFSRMEAAGLIPKSNPFLRKLFQYIAGYDLDDRIKWIVDDLADIFRATNVAELLKDFGKSTQQNDPLVHFYETFLSEYDPSLRKSRGVWYTPEPVVNFIVRAVDDILKTEFGLPMGLADTSKTRVMVNVQGQKVEKEVHKVQILDPATGTGTFLAEVVKLIYRQFEGQQGIWNNYVEEHLIPRLNGFEILMASYTIAHMKMDLLLRETGYDPDPIRPHPNPPRGGGSQLPSFGGAGGGQHQRLRIYLTNSLEEYHPDTGTLFANWLSTEANEANHIKRDTPVMVVIGNPPYSVSSNNKGNWIEKLTADYKKDLNERNIQPLSDDYIKFIRYGQYLVEKNGSGILAYISNNSFIDGIIHRQMRKHLLENFDSIYILDLHGNSKKKEVCQDGSADQNVFDIMQGVSINLFVKTGKKKKNERGQILHSYLFGKREKKYVFLNLNTLKSIEWIKLESNYPNYFFVNKNFEDKAKYEKGFKVDELFIQSNVGLATEFDEFSIKNSRKEAEELLKVLQSTSAPEIISKYKLNPKKVEKVENAIKDIKNNNPIITAIDYRPFDFKYTVYTGVSNGLMGRPRDGIMRHMLKNNLALLTCRQQTSFDFQHVFISNKISERCSVSLQTGEVNYIFPLFLYPENITQQTIGHKTTRFPNLNIEIVKQIAEKIGLTFVPERDSPPPEGCPKGGVVINHIPIKRNFVENLPYNPALKQLAIDKRKAGILSEVLFWQQVYKGRFHQIDFDRQRIIGNYIVDFYVKTLGLVVEIDGDSHDEKTEYDARRQQYLENLGLKVYRIQDGDVKHNLEIVMLELERYIVREYGERTTPAFSHPSEGGEWSPIDILDYIYAVLHSPTYREKYKEFLKIDFPRVPYPKDKDTFWQLVKLGGELRQIHLLECPMVEKRITTYPLAGNNQVEKVWFEIDLSLTLPKGEGTAPPPLEGPGEVQNYSLPIPPPLLEGPGEVSVSDNENNLPGYITANPITYSVIKDYREILKSNPTEAEKVIWEFLRNKKTGYKIRRQHVIDDFITDFVCLPKKVVIEIDGKIHDFHKDYDTLRTLRLNMLGYKVIRFSNEEVLLNPQKVAEKIRVVLDQTSFLALNTSPDLSDCDRDPTPTLPKGEGADSPPLEGRGEVWAVSTEVGKVWINSTQYFVGVPKIAWEFYIGGYQPAQKWLKDRKGRTLGFEDILHYQKIVVALTETDRLMKEIDKIEIE